MFIISGWKMTSVSVPSATILSSGPKARSLYILMMMTIMMMSTTITMRIAGGKDMVGAVVVVMLVMFLLGFVLDFIEITFVVVPIVGPVIYGGTVDPKWVTIMIAVNLQTSFLTPPFGFALFYLRGVAPKEVTTGHIYRGVFPFVLIQVVGLAILWFFPAIVTIVPNLIPN